MEYPKTRLLRVEAGDRCAQVATKLYPDRGARVIEPHCANQAATPTYDV